MDIPKGKFKNLNKYFSIKKIFLNTALIQLVGVVSANFMNLVFFIFKIKIDKVIGKNKKKLKYDSFFI